MIDLGFIRAHISIDEQYFGVQVQPAAFSTTFHPVSRPSSLIKSAGRQFHFQARAAQSDSAACRIQTRAS
jgi:hypothetical protein